MASHARDRAALAIAVFAFVSLSGVRPCAAEEVFTAIAEAVPVRGSTTGQIGVTIVVRRATGEAECLQFKNVLESGGQGALVAALRGRTDGALRLGPVEQPLGLITFRPTSKGRRLIVVTARRIQVEEINDGAESLDYPFGVAVVDLDGWDQGEGVLYNAAALGVDADGTITVKGYKQDPGRLLEVCKK